MRPKIFIIFVSVNFTSIFGCFPTVMKLHNDLHELTNSKGSNILVATGYNYGFRDYSQVIDTQSTNSCSNLPPYPLKLYKATGGVLNGSPLICGGYGGSSVGSGWGQAGSFQSSCYMYDKTSQAWKLHANMNTKRGSPASAVVNGALWVTGGFSYTASTEFIYPNGTVSQGPNLPAKRGGHCMVTLLDGKVMIIGGRPDLKSVLIFDPADNTFTTGPSLIFKRQYTGCALFLSPLHDNRPVVLAAGGSSQHTEVFDYTNADAWEQIGSLTYTYHNDFKGATALPSLSGNGAYFQYKKYLFELTCTSSSCDWSTMQKQLSNSVDEAVMMQLPSGYTC